MVNLGLNAYKQLEHSDPIKCLFSCEAELFYVSFKPIFK